MYAEWLVEIPADLQENWYVVMCPVGKRCLVTTAKGMKVVIDSSISFYVFYSESLCIVDPQGRLLADIVMVEHKPSLHARYSLLTL
jgi:hypothetical protein